MGNSSSSDGEPEPKLTNQQIKDLKREFDELDLNHDGVLDRKELTRLLQGVGIKPTLERMDKLMFELDQDRDGVIDFAEFID